MQPEAEPQEAQPALEFHGPHGFRAIDHHWQGDRFATAGAQVNHLHIMKYPWSLETQPLH